MYHVLTGILGLFSTRGAERAPNALVVLHPMSGKSQPLIWGKVNGSFPGFQSREELDAILVAAFYHFGLPREEVARMRKILDKERLYPNRTRLEAMWRKALQVGQRTEANDLALIDVGREIARMKRAEGASNSPGEPIVLDPTQANRHFTEVDAYVQIFSA